MTRPATCLFLATLAFSTTPVSADTARSNEDCAELLERWSTDPKVAPRSEIEACKNQLAAIAPAAGEPLKQAASSDPCAGPDAAGSVLCWGPWASVAPAAGPGLEPTLLVQDDPETRPETSDLFDPEVVPELPLGTCAAGTPCGFATIVDGPLSVDDASATEFGRFTLNPDGSRFTVTPTGGTPINSGTAATITITPRLTDSYGNLRTATGPGNTQSRLTARVEQDDEGDIEMAVDAWRHGTIIDGITTVQSGYFVWGNTLAQSALDSLSAGNVSVDFTGPMSVDKNTVGAMTVNFGASPTWSGTWTNPGYSFGAGGVVTGANLISVNNQFSSNVVANPVGAGNFVQGALLGDSGGNPGIAHVIDVTLEDVGRIKDVGLLRDVVPSPIAP